MWPATKCCAHFLTRPVATTKDGATGWVDRNGDETPDML
jgi:hypothetical protein